MAETLERFDYPRQGKADKGLLRRFLVRVAGLSRAQVTRLLRQHRTTGAIADRRGPRRPFPRRCTKADIGLLAESTPSTAPSWTRDRECRTSADIKARHVCR